MNEFGKKTTWKMRLLCTLLTISYKKQKQTLVKYFNFIFTQTFSILLKSSQTISDKTLTKKNTEKLLNEIFTTDKDENESRIEAFIDENEIKMGE